MNDTLEVKDPEYLTWPLERLQVEYHALNLKYLAERLQQVDKDHRVEDVDTFIAALKRLMEEE